MEWNQRKRKENGVQLSCEMAGDSLLKWRKKKLCLHINLWNKFILKCLPNHVTWCYLWIRHGWSVVPIWPNLFGSPIHFCFAYSVVRYVRSRNFFFLVDTCLRKFYRIKSVPHKFSYETYVPFSLSLYFCES